MPEITYAESTSVITRLSGQARESEQAGSFDEAIVRLSEMLAHPCAHHQVVAYEVWDEIHQLQRRAGRYDDAIAAKLRAIDEGYRSEPDPEADIAECHLLVGRRDEADRIFAELRAKSPDDVWLYNAAGFSYAHADHHVVAEGWLRDGLDVALRTGDADLVAPQLLDLLHDTWHAGGTEPDAVLTKRVEAFCEAWEPVDRGRRWVDDLPEHAGRRCAHCGFEPDRSHAERDELARRHRERALRDEAPEALARLEALPSFDDPLPRTPLREDLELSVAWFPAGEWATAVERWPHLLDALPRDHATYSREIEARVKQIAQAVPGRPLHVSPLTVDGLVADAEAHGEDPGTAEARSAFAAEVLRTGGAIGWPPMRNQACWCGSARKYKHCCGPVPAASD